MTTHHRQISSSSWKLLAMVGGLLTGFFPLGVHPQMAPPAFAAPAAAVESDAKVSIANFAFTPGEITIAPGVSVTWTNDDGAPWAAIP